MGLGSLSAILEKITITISTLNKEKWFGDKLLTLVFAKKHEVFSPVWTGKGPMPGVFWSHYYKKAN